MMFRHRLILLVFMMSSICIPALGQSATMMTLNGDNAGDIFGSSVSGAGDVNGDGFDDYIVAAPQDDNNGTDSGSARVYSGFDNTVLYSLNGDNVGDNFGASVSAAGDVNGDGLGDFIVGATGDDQNGLDSGLARVFSGFDGSILYTFRGDNTQDFLGISVDGLGDVNGDGFGDVIVGAFGSDQTATNGGLARVFSGIDGSVLYAITGNSINAALGFSVSRAGDVNGDGTADFVIGAYGDSTAFPFAGSVQIFSGLDGGPIHSIFGTNNLGQLGISVAAAGDVNNDGFDDVIASSVSGNAVVYSGLNGAQIRFFVGVTGNFFSNTAVDGAGDVNGDGFADLIIGNSSENHIFSGAGSARIYSGIDGTLLFELFGQGPFYCFGRSVSGAGDLNGDGFSDVIIGAPRAATNGADSGSARVVTAPTKPVLRFSTNSSLPHFLDLAWLPDGGNPDSVTGTILCSHAIPGASGLVSVSLGRVDSILLGFIPVLVDDDPAKLILQGSFGFDLGGRLVAPGITRQFPALAGNYSFVQFFQTSPLILSSNGLRFELVP